MDTVSLLSATNGKIAKTRKMRTLVFPISRYYGSFSIHEGDYIAIRELLGNTGVNSNCKVHYIAATNNERRVYELKLPIYHFSFGSVFSLPSSIGELIGLKRLNLGHSKVMSLPPSIGDLVNLEELDLKCTLLLKELPEELGRLVRLKKLILCKSGIRYLPESIGRLRNLQHLNLSEMAGLQTIPEEISNMTALKKLDLRQPYDKRALPKSISQLLNLQKLNLSHTMIAGLPEEVGDLASLEYLDLMNSGVRSLPHSIGKLKHLKILNLSSTRFLTELPETVGNLSRLVKLSLWGSSIKSLPKSTKNLQRLEALYLDNELARYQHHFLLQLVRMIPSLVCLGWHCASEMSAKIKHELVCNRARSMMEFAGDVEDSFLERNPKMWPFVLKKATRAYRSSYTSLTTTDSLYQLFLDGREIFIRFLIYNNRIESL